MNRRKFLKNITLGASVISLPAVSSAKASTEKDKCQEFVCKGVTEDFYNEWKEREWSEYEIGVFYFKGWKTFLRDEISYYNINYLPSGDTIKTRIRKNGKDLFVNSGLSFACHTGKDEGYTVDINPIMEEPTKEQSKAIKSIRDFHNDDYISISSDVRSSILSIRGKFPQKSEQIAEIKFSAKKESGYLKIKKIEGWYQSLMVGPINFISGEEKVDLVGKPLRLVRALNFK